MNYQNLILHGLIKRKIRLILVLLIVSLNITIISCSNQKGQSTGKLLPTPKVTIHFYEDKSNSLTYSQISSKLYVEKFKKSDKNVLFFGLSDAAFWIKIRTDNVTNESNWCLHINYIQNSYIDVYDSTFAGDSPIFKTGFLRPVSNRPIKPMPYAFPLKFNSGHSSVLFLKIVSNGTIIIPVSVIRNSDIALKDSKINFWYGIYFGIIIGLFLYNLFLFVGLRDRTYFYYICILASTLVFFATISGHMLEYFLSEYLYFNEILIELSLSCILIFGGLFAVRLLRIKKFSKVLYNFFFIIISMNALCIPFIFIIDLRLIQQIQFVLLPLQVIITLISGIISWKNKDISAGYYTIAWIGYMTGGLINIAMYIGILPFNSITYHAPEVGSAIEVILLSLILTKRYQIYKKEKEDAIHLALNIQKEANETLEQKVTERTLELNKTLNELKETQQQLVQQEKLASLGGLTAGIAHEIKNPLNFVNNFAELSNELLDEFEENKNPEERKELLKIIRQNLQKINEHGKRADGIVKSMLEHSRSGLAEKQLTDINKLCDEYSNLAYHGMRATVKDFNCIIEKHFSNGMPEIKVVYQDISRVILNLINNAFYAIKDKSNAKFEISTEFIRSPFEIVNIRIIDNGTGIPEHIKQKIFEPFFTTKPSGQGTGLGLSLSFEIIKAHGGRIEVLSEEGKGTEFIITLPCN